MVQVNAFFYNQQLNFNSTENKISEYAFQIFSKNKLPKLTTPRGSDKSCQITAAIVRFIHETEDNT